MPDFALVDTRGDTVSLASLVADRPLLFCYETYYFAPFLRADVIAAMQQWQARFGRDLNVLYVAGGNLPEDRLRALAAAKVGSLRVAVDDGTVFTGYQPGYYTLYLIDSHGVLRLRRTWSPANLPEITETITATIAERAVAVAAM